MTPFEQQTRERFEAQGVALVRLRVQSGLMATELVAPALTWLAEKEAEAAAERETRVRTAEARQTFNAVMLIANAIIAICSLVIGVLAWVHPLR